MADIFRIILLKLCGYIMVVGGGCPVSYGRQKQLVGEHDCLNYEKCNSYHEVLKESKDCNNDVSDHHYNRKLSKDT